MGKSQGVIHQLVRVMGLCKPKGIHNQQFRTLQIRILTLLYGLHVSNIGQFAYTIAQYRQFAMHDLNRHDIKIANTEGFVLVNLMKSDGRHPRIAIFCETIWQHLQHPLSSNRISIDVNLTKLTIWTNIIHSTHMIIVAMGYQDAVDFTKRHGKDLLPEIRTAVNEQPRLICLYKYRATRTLIMRICTLTHLTLAANDRHATRSSCSQKSQLHIMFTSG